MFLPILILAAQAAAQTPSPAPDRPNPMDLGPAIGQTLPPFEAKDQNGVVRDLASLTGPNGLMLVFFRSADW